MRTLTHLVLIQLLVFTFGCNQPTSSSANLPRIAIAGLSIDSSTISHTVTQEAAYHARVGEDVFTYYPFLSEDAPNRARAEWFPTLRGHALPGGIVSREAYESLVGKTLEMLKENL